MGDDLSKIPYVLGLGRRTRRTLTINLAIAFGARLHSWLARSFSEVSHFHSQ